MQTDTRVTWGMFIGLSLLVIRTNTLFPLVASVISLMKLWLSRQSANLPVSYAFTPSSMSVLFLDGFNPRAGLDHFLLYNNPTQRYKITFTRNLVHVFSKQLPHQLKLIHCSMVLSLSFFLVQVELYVTRVTTHNTCWNCGIQNWHIVMLGCSLYPKFQLSILQRSNM